MRIGARAIALGSVVAVASGCPTPPPEEGPCAGDGDPLIMLANRSGGSELGDGDEVEVFPPPQGGVFTELDITIDDMASEELEDMFISVVATDTGEALATVRYFGASLQGVLRCTTDDVLVLDNVPVGFDDGLELSDLDGVAAVLTGTLQTTRGDFESRYEVVLRATDY